MFCTTAGLSAPAAKSWPWSWKRRATAFWEATPKHECGAGQGERVPYELRSARAAVERRLAAVGAAAPQGGHGPFRGKRLSHDARRGVAFYRRVAPGRRLLRAGP